MQRLNTKEIKQVNGGFVFVIPLIAGGLDAIFQAAIATTAAVLLKKTLEKESYTTCACY